MILLVVFGMQQRDTSSIRIRFFSFGHWHILPDQAMNLKGEYDVFITPLSGLQAVWRTSTLKKGIKKKIKDQLTCFQKNPLARLRAPGYVINDFLDPSPDLPNDVWLPSLVKLIKKHWTFTTPVLNAPSSILPPWRQYSMKCGLCFPPFYQERSRNSKL